ncbi:hypothetical protein PsalN5692_01516 [Piscirickettsia salmonis]|nr:hypothetical protein PsalN5692_01516 [Piscirickettsia salmonis]
MSKIVKFLVGSCSLVAVMFFLVIGLSTLNQHSSISQSQLINESIFN